jgi:hypothetical protein
MTTHAFIICGSREWRTRYAIDRLMIELPDGALIIHGDCDRGADEMADESATVHPDLTILKMPAQWDAHGKSAGPRRNESMLRVLKELRHCGYEVAVHAFPLGESRGTRHMMRIAEATGITVHDHGDEHQ